MFPLLSLFLFFLQIYITQSPNNNCSDPSCLHCSSVDDSYCFKCKPGFVRHYSKCGKKCSSIVNCHLCDITEKKCVKCKSNCVFNGTYCDCTERFILTAVCLTFSIFMIFTFFFCLLHKSILRTFATFSILSGRISSINWQKIQKECSYLKINKIKITSSLTISIILNAMKLNPWQ